MQKIYLIWNILLTIAFFILLAIVYQDHVTDKKENSAPQLISPLQTQKLQEGSTKIVFVNMDTLYAKYKYVDELRKQLEKVRKAKQKELEIQYRDLEKEISEFREIASRLSENEAQKQQYALMEKEQDLLQLREKLNLELYNNEAEMNEKLSQRINEYLKKYKKQIPFDYVLSYTRGGGILYTNDSLDITRQVVEGLNEEYNQSKNKKKN